MVEFALVFPILILLIVLVFDAGRAVFTFNAITNAAREGARLAIVNQDLASVQQRVQAIAFSPTQMINVTYHSTTPSADPGDNPACNPIAVGCVAVVIVTAPYQPLTPLVSRVWPSLTITARSELPVELVCPNPDIAAFSTVSLCPRQP